MKIDGFNVVQFIIEHESGELDFDGTLSLFAYLVKSGMAWTLQGHYGRTAARMIEDGTLSKTGEILMQGGE